MDSTQWTSLEIAKLIASTLTPVTVALFGWYLTRFAKSIEHRQWRNQRLIEKRIAIYDDLSPHLNDLLCFFTFVGCWKELAPPQVIAIKRVVDKKNILQPPCFQKIFSRCVSDSCRFVSIHFKVGGKMQHCEPR